MDEAWESGVVVGSSVAFSKWKLWKLNKHTKFVSLERFGTEGMFSPRNLGPSRFSQSCIERKKKVPSVGM